MVKIPVKIPFEEKGYRLVLNRFNINKTQTKQYEQKKYIEREQRFHIQ